MAVPKDINNSTAELNLGDLELLHDWTMGAYTGFGDKEGDEKSQEFLQSHRGNCLKNKPDRALANPWLLYPDYLAVAAYHQNLALPSYRYLVEDLKHRMDKANAQAIIAFGRLTIAYAFACPHPPGSILFAGLCASTGFEHGQLPDHTHVIQDFGDSIDFSLSPDDHHLAALGDDMEKLPLSNPDEVEERRLSPCLGELLHFLGSLVNIWALS
ncbi:hypothetical protein N431DRAFT_468731 [Stipitochalara longipes BDJ]|nr:hypothetical protein N431DRAFT_468731 [Stipitochalara longipes BDJ]